MKKFMFIAAALIMGAACAKTSTTVSGLDPQAFATDSTSLYVLRNACGMEACITNFGARIVSLMVPASDGSMKDVVLGFPDIESYTANSSAYGALIGPYANRIAGGHFCLGGKEYQLEKNKNGNSLHSGSRTWQYSCFSVVGSTESSLSLRVVSPDGEFGLPGDVTLDVTYTLTDDNRLDISYRASTSDSTVINVTNHSFFNLSGDSQKTVYDDLLCVKASCFTPTDGTQIPTGELAPVEGTPFDFRVPKAIGQDINADNEQLAVAKGYDHNFVLDTLDMSSPSATLYCPATGIVMDVYTDQPGIQVYSANNVNADLRGKDGLPFVRQAAICLETQHFPDSPNKPQFPSTALAPGIGFTSHTVYAFSVRAE